MARWKLMTPHYLNVGKNCEWEYRELSRTTGKQQRKMYLVPRYINPEDPSDWTQSFGPKGFEEGEVIVCHEGKGQPSDIVFYGDPTPDMTPVDDEAREISANFETLWSYKPEESPGEFSQSLITKFQSDMADTQTRPAPIEGMSELIAVMTQSMKQQAELIAALAPSRRV